MEIVKFTSLEPPSPKYVTAHASFLSIFKEYAAPTAWGICVLQIKVVFAFCSFQFQNRWENSSSDTNKNNSSNNNIIKISYIKSLVHRTFQYLRNS